MTTTPESWDDVGCLRLQVGCTSQIVEDLQLNFSQFQKLSGEQVLEQKKAIRQIKVLLATTTGLCACVLVLLCCDFLQNTTSQKPDLHRNLRTIQQLKQKPMSDAVLKHLQAAEELLAEQQHLENTGESAEKIVSSLEHFGEAHVAAKKRTSWKGVEKNESEPRLTTKLQVESAQHIQSSAGTEERIQRVTKSIAEDSKEAREDTAGTKDTDGNEGEDHDDGEAFGEQPSEEPGGEPKLHPPINLDAAVSEDPAERERREAIVLDALPPLPFQLMSSFVSNKEVLQRSSHGLFWVCFPPSSLEQNIKTYAPVFNEVARSKEWRMYPFVYLDTRVLKRYGDHQCDDVDQITFVMEKKSDLVSEGKLSPTELSLDVWTFNSNWYNPVWFKRVFRPDQVIQPSLVKKFLDDVRSGKLPKIRSAKGDL